MRGKIKMCNLDDYCAQETDALLLSIYFERVKPTKPQMAAFKQRLKFLKDDLQRPA